MEYKHSLGLRDLDKWTLRKTRVSLDGGKAKWGLPASGLAVAGPHCDWKCWRWAAAGLLPWCDATHLPGVHTAFSTAHSCFYVVFMVLPIAHAIGFSLQFSFFRVSLKCYMGGQPRGSVSISYTRLWPSSLCSVQ